jgi:peroxiredoxin
MDKKNIILIIFLFSISFANNLHLPKIDLKDLNNKRQSLDKYHESGPLLLNFWNLACEPCKKEMKELDKIYVKHREKGFEYVSINIDSPRSMAKVKSFVKSQKYSFTVLSDPKASLFRKMGGKVMPFVIIADSSGSIISRHVGYNPGDEKELEKEILHLLAIQNSMSDSILIQKNTIIKNDSLNIQEELDLKNK